MYGERAGGRYGPENSGICCRELIAMAGLILEWSQENSWLEKENRKEAETHFFFKEEEEERIFGGCRAAIVVAAGRIDLFSQVMDDRFVVVCQQGKLEVTW